MKSTATRKISFAFRDSPGKMVYTAGTFNNWDPNADQLVDRHQTGDYAVSLRIPRGPHEYKFVVDGAWLIDPANPDCVLNSHGSLNSLIVV